jgi:hypothetical protein
MLRQLITEMASFVLGSIIAEVTALDVPSYDLSGEVEVEVEDNEINLDTTPPVITLNGQNSITIEQGTHYNDAGATAIDNIDGIVKVTIKGSVNTSKIGTYIIIYSAIDKAGNSTTQKRTIKVIEKQVIIPSAEKDTTPPVITLRGKSPVETFLRKDYIDLGATAIDNIDGIVNVITTGLGNVDISKIGTYTITYNAVDKAGNTTSKKRTIKVIEEKDTTPPVITLIGKDFITIEQEFFYDGKLTTKIKNNKIYKELGATAIDNIDGSVKVTQSGNVNSYKIGTYIITYSAVDKSGNKATKKRTVKVVYDNTPPVITLKGKDSIRIPQGTKYKDAGATAIDNRDGKIKVTIEGRVNSSKVGSYTLIYTATDKAGNKSTKNRTVTVFFDKVIPLTPNKTPTIKLKGQNPISLRLGTRYIEAGATATDTRGRVLKVKIGGDIVQIYRAGTYIITYTATEPKGQTTTKTRTVHVTKFFFLSKTEQSISYKVFDDGYYQKGQESDLIRDDEKEVVIDRTRELMWQDDIQTQSIKMKWLDSYCKNLTLGNYNGWRVPNREELLSIVNYNKYTPSTYDIFEHIKSDNYWSSTINIHDKNSMWTVNFDDGSTILYPKSSKNSIRCVRNNRVKEKK